MGGKKDKRKVNNLGGKKRKKKRSGFWYMNTHATALTFIFKFGGNRCPPVFRSEVKVQCIPVIFFKLQKKVNHFGE